MIRDEIQQKLNSAVNVSTGPDVRGWKKVSDFWFSKVEKVKGVTFRRHEQFLFEILKNVRPEDALLTFREDGERITVNIYVRADQPAGVPPS